MTRALAVADARTGVRFARPGRRNGPTIGVSFVVDVDLTDLSATVDAGRKRSNPWRIQPGLAVEIGWRRSAR